MASAVASSKSSASLNRGGETARFVICVDPEENGDLQARRIYRIIPDSTAKKENYLRVVDDSGEDYLYPARLFLPMHVTAALRTALGKAEQSGT